MLAADQRITAWARQLRAAGLDGDMDVLRARAYLDLLLGKDSRPRQDGGGGQDGPDQPAGSSPAGPAASVVLTGFAGRINLTISLATLLGLADRPGEIGGIGPIDPALARDLARAAAGQPQDHLVRDGHRPGRARHRARLRPARTQEPARPLDKRQKPGPPDGRDPPCEAGDGPGFAFTTAGQHGPPGGYGTWRLRTGTGGQRDLLVALEPITTQACDHRFEARGHDPGSKLRHLSQVRARHLHCTDLPPTC